MIPLLYWRPYMVMVLGLFLAIALWFSTLPALGALQIQREQADAGPVIHNEMLLSALPFQSALIRIRADDCLTGLRINDAIIEPTQLQLPICAPDMLTFDVAPYLSAGTNKIAADFKDNGSAYGGTITTMHSTATACLMALPVCLFFYGAFLACRQRRAAGAIDWQEWLLITALLAFAVSGWLYFLDFKSMDYGMVIEWLNHIRRKGLLRAYGDGFSNYAPAYTYLLGIGDLFLPLRGLYTIKFITLVGTIAMAGLVYDIVKKHGPKSAVTPAIAACLFLASPSIIINGASATQCDIFYSLFLVATLYMLYVDRPVRALLFYGIAISFKLQAIFLSPFLLIFLLRRTIPLRFFWIPAAVYVVIMLPCVLEGRDFIETLSVYWGQFNTVHDLGNAGNFHYLLYRYFSAYFVPLRNMALIVTVCSASAFAFVTHKRWRDRKDLSEYVLLASFCVALMPFLLPQMLDRYFFPAEIFALLLGCLKPRLLPITLLSQASTMLVYPDSQFALTDQLLGWSFDMRHGTAALLNLTAILWLGVLCWRYIWRKNPAILD